MWATVPLRSTTQLRHPAGEGELCQTQGVGAIRGGLAGGDQLVGGGDRIVDRDPKAEQDGSEASSQGP